MEEQLSGHVPAEGEVAEEAVQEEQQQPTPEFVTKEMLQDQLKALQEQLAEQSRRTAQSYSDKTREKISRELEELSRVLEDPDIAEYLGEDKEEVLRKKKAKIIEQAYYQPKPQEQLPEWLDEATVTRLWSKTVGAGFSEKNPDDVDVLNSIDPRYFMSEAAWERAFNLALKARHTPQAPTSPAQPAPQPAQQQPTTSPPGTPMDMGTRAAAPSTITTLAQQFDEAHARGDEKAAREILAKMNSMRAS